MDLEGSNQTNCNENCVLNVKEGTLTQIRGMELRTGILRSRSRAWSTKAPSVSFRSQFAG